MKCIVSDTGPILPLFESHSLELLHWAGQIHVPIAVEEELDSLVLNWPSHKPAWITTTSLDEHALHQAHAWFHAGLLDRGEAQAIALVQQMKADWFLTDDSSARLVARAFEIETHGSLGVVLWAAATGCLDCTQAEAHLKGLADSSLWISPLVVEEARQALKKLFS